MKKFVLTVLLLAATAGPALAIGRIGIFGDDAGLSCSISDPGGSVFKVIYIIHTGDVQPAIGSAWTLTWDPGMTMVYMSDDASPWFKNGNAQDGASISYYTCQTGVLKIDAVTFLSLGTSAPCSYFRLAPHPTLGRSVIYCNFAYVPFLGGEAIVNANATCPCSVATEQTTWGSVKALYR